jgi:hypothetical protein
MGKAAIFAVAVVAAVNAMPGSANAERYYPWCAWYDDWTYNCSFATHAQCMATISGVGGICKPNPYSSGENPRARRRY